MENLPEESTDRVSRFATPISIYAKHLKRLFDIILALCGIGCLLPLMFIIALLIRIESGSPVIFKQRRVGMNEVCFDMLKFRTMKLDAPNDVPTHMLSDPKMHITRIGGFLRKSSLDELPQLWNILLGHMSFVGPRPALCNQHDLIAERHIYGANALRPGLTGWAQVNGRDELNIEEKARLDGEYVRRISFLFDIKCLIITAVRVIRREGIVEGNTQCGK